jgi:hypothetical protein
MAGKTVQNRAVRILHLRQSSGLQACHIVFIGGQEPSRVLEILGSVRDLPVLTAGEANAFVQQGGMIGFRTENERIRFDVNVGAAERCNMRFSSSLLSFARTVFPGSGSGT